MKISEIIRKFLSFDIVIPLSDRIILMPDEDGRFTIGSDGGMIKYTLKPLHTGVSVIKAVYDWRGSVEKTVTHTITVR